MRLQYIAGGMLALLTVAIAPAQILPQPDPPFQGKVDIDPAKSTPDWPKPVTAPKGAPNVVLILLDDVGFGATSTFGGAAPTPALDRLAAGGLRYNRFHVNAMCSPTRGALLSGRNSHEIGFGMIAESAVGYPGYNAEWPKSSAGIAEVLKLNGYSTAAFGKWHNTPVWDVNPAGPFERWPFGLGFEYFYGFLGAATSQWEPNLYRNLSAVEATASPKEGYHLTTDLVNDAIGWVRKHDAITPSKPFFLYFATGATHAPHHVPKEWVDKFKGKFDEGWDKLRQDTFNRQKELGVIPTSAELTPRPKEIVAWDSLSSDLKKMLAHQMEVYAAFLAQTDYEVGRLLEAIRAEGHTEDTAVIYIAGDNGASAEGGTDGRDAVTAQGMPQSLEERSSQYDALGSETFTNIQVNDTHASLFGIGLDARPPVGACGLPVRIRFEEKQAVVTGISTASGEGIATGLQIGDMITDLDGVAVPQLVGNWTPYYAASNDAARLRDIAGTLTNGDCEKPAELRVRREAATLNLTVKRVNPTPQTSDVAHDLPGPDRIYFSNTCSI